jgi:hypothetical protein
MSSSKRVLTLIFMRMLTICRIVHFKLLTMESQLSRPWDWHLLDYSQLHNAAGNRDIVLFIAKALSLFFFFFFFMAVVKKVVTKIYSLPIYHTFSLTFSNTIEIASTFKNDKLHSKAITAARINKTKTLVLVCVDLECRSKCYGPPATIRNQNFSTFTFVI